MNEIREDQIIEKKEDTTETIKDEHFSYEGYQVVRGEFFAHLFEPSVTFNDEKVSVNTACINKLPDVDYVQFLVNPIEKKLAVKPCSEEMRDSFCWISEKQGRKRKPKMISCRIFYAKVMNLMGWNPECRYKVLGKLIKTQADMLFVFDLASAETYIKRKGKNGSRAAFYPEEWKNQFGVSVKDHQDLTLVSIFDDYTVFKIEKGEDGKERVSDGNNFIGHEEKTDSCVQENVNGD